MIQRVVLLL